MSALSIASRAVAAIDDNYTFQGRVLSEEDSLPIGGAVVQVVGASAVSFTNTQGYFRIVSPTPSLTLIVRSVGRHTATIFVPSHDTNIVIRLATKVISTRAVTVVADIDAAEIIRRAIARRSEAKSRVQRFSADIYNRRTKTRQTNSAERRPHPEYIQTLARCDAVFGPQGPIIKSTVLSRQSSKSWENKADPGLVYPFDDFLSDTLVLDSLFGGIRIVRPLASDGLSRYDFHIKQRLIYDNTVMYVIDFQPKTRLTPGFEGTVHIIEGSYSIASVQYRTTPETAIPFIDSLIVEQRYDEVLNDLWLPVSSELRLYASINAFFGLIGRRFEYLLHSDVLRYRVNSDAPDSLFDSHAYGTSTARRTTRRNRQQVDEGDTVAFKDGTSISVAINANSHPSGFWDSLLVQKPTEYELRLMAAADTTSPRKRLSIDYDSLPMFSTALFTFALGDASFRFFPRLGRTSVSGFLYGGGLGIDYHKFSLVADLSASSFIAPLGKVSFFYSLQDSPMDYLRFGISLHRSLSMIHQPQPTIGSTVNATHLLFGTARDFYGVSGFDASLEAKFGVLDVTSTFERARHNALPPVGEVDRSIPTVQEGLFSVGRFKVSLIDSSLSSFLGGIQRSQFVGSLEIGLASRSGDSELHGWIIADASALLPTFRTGYEDMTLRCGLRLRLASTMTPGQFYYYSTPRFVFAGDINDLLTIPLNTFAGNRQYQLIVEHNFSDLLWRAVGLPLFNKRGIDIALSYAATRFEHSGIRLSDGMRQSDGWYQEIGIGIDRVPSLLLDHLNLRFEVRLPVGHLRGLGHSLGWAFGISSVLF